MAFCLLDVFTMLTSVPGSADVHIDNVQSQGVCKGLGGEKGWRNCWCVSKHLTALTMFRGGLTNVTKDCCRS